MRQTRSNRTGLGRAAGFTLVEMIVAITLLGILAAVSVPMMRLPMTAYLDSAMRTNLNDEMDIVASKLRADMALAVPGSVRVTPVAGNHWVLEFLQVRAVGRYRRGVANPAPPVPLCPAACSGAATRDRLDRTAADNCFTTIGPLQAVGGAVPMPVPAAYYAVVNPTAGSVYSSGAASGGAKSRLLQVVNGAPNQGSCLVTQPVVFSPDTGTSNVYVVDTPVTYDCNPVTRQLTRRWGYAVAFNQPLAFAAAVPSAVLATQISDCRFAMRMNVAGENQVAVMWMQFRGLASGTAVPEVADAPFEFSVKAAP